MKTDGFQNSVNEVQRIVTDERLSWGSLIEDIAEVLLTN